MVSSSREHDFNAKNTSKPDLGRLKTKLLRKNRLIHNPISVCHHVLDNQVLVVTQVDGELLDSCGGPKELWLQIPSNFMITIDELVAP